MGAAPDDDLVAVDPGWFLRAGLGRDCVVVLAVEEVETMTLLIACLLIHGFGLSPVWYVVAGIVWIVFGTINVLGLHY